MYDYDDMELEKCPHCGKLIPANIFKCPKCGEYTTGGTVPLRRHARWVVATAIILAAVLLAWIVTRP